MNIEIRPITEDEVEELDRATSSRLRDEYGISAAELGQVRELATGELPESAWAAPRRPDPSTHGEP